MKFKSWLFLKFPIFVFPLDSASADDSRVKNRTSEKMSTGIDYCGTLSLCIHNADQLCGLDCLEECMDSGKIVMDRNMVGTIDW